ncbi:MAG TPA: DUF2231 domain-containing protein [Actinomycetes bacterium]|nr:DUF2231 domain-containing protein [Actinomycetes bacterium]
MPETVGGLPVHPLVVHAVVVLIPLSAIGVITMALVPRWRRTLGFSVLLVSIAATAMVPVAKFSGENLQREIASTPLIIRHRNLAETLLYFAVPLLLVAIVLWWRSRGSLNENTGSGTMSVIISVVAVVVALAALVQVVRVGHSGSDAVWSGVLSSAP